LTTRTRIFGAQCAAVLFLGLALATPAQAAFPGQNGKIAFTRALGDVGDIYVMNPDGSGVQNLTASSGDASRTAAAWSPNGTQVVLARGCELATMAADGSNITPIPGLPTGCALAPAWLPDGTRIGFTNELGSRPPSYTTYTANPDGSGLADLGHAIEAVWAADGTKIAFANLRVFFDFSAEHNIGVMDPDGSNRALVTSDGGSGAPDWSPDGRTIVFQTDRDGDFEIYTMNADGTGAARLTSSPGWDLAPVWSPDGTKIAFQSFRDGNSEIYVMNADGSGQTRLTNDPATDYFPDWQPLAGPRRADYKNAAKFCKAERAHLGEEAFGGRYGGGANAHGKCVSSN
jgi:Tol biopolymer transport system component